VGEILKQVQDDRSEKFQICLASFLKKKSDQDIEILQIPLNPPLPAFGREKIIKGGSISPPFGKGRWGGIL